ncbi:MAG: hypothetical protein J7L34_07375 [Thermotogaceae bacterium]|nr:hypothetical protein [Thermotogaceae bacterium]
MLWVKLKEDVYIPVDMIAGINGNKVVLKDGSIYKVDKKVKKEIIDFVKDNLITKRLSIEQGLEKIYWVL